MQDFQGRKRLIHSSHEALQKDDLRQTHSQGPQVTGEGIEVIEVVQLHGVREIQGHVPQVRAFVGQLM